MSSTFSKIRGLPVASHGTKQRGTKNPSRHTNKTHSSKIRTSSSKQNLSYRPGGRPIKTRPASRESSSKPATLASDSARRETPVGVAPPRPVHTRISNQKVYGAKPTTITDEKIYVTVRERRLKEEKARLRRDRRRNGKRGNQKASQRCDTSDDISIPSVLPDEREEDEDEISLYDDPEATQEGVFFTRKNQEVEVYSNDANDSLDKHSIDNAFESGERDEEENSIDVDNRNDNSDNEMSKIEDALHQVDPADDSAETWNDAVEEGLSVDGTVQAIDEYNDNEDSHLKHLHEDPEMSAALAAAEAQMARSSQIPVALSKASHCENPSSPSSPPEALMLASPPVHQSPGDPEATGEEQAVECDSLCSQPSRENLVQEAILAQHARLGIPTNLQYTYAPARRDLPVIKFSRVSDFGEYEYFGKRGKSNQAKSSDNNSKSKPSNDASQRHLQENGNRVQKDNDKATLKSPQKVSQNSSVQSAAIVKSKDLSPTSISPTGKVRRGSSLRTHIPGCTCMRCRKARRAPSRLPTKLLYRLMGSEAKIVQATLKKNGFRYTKRKGPGEWNIIWTTQQLRSYDYQGMNRYQRVNQYPRTHEITRKDTLCRNISRMKEIHGERWFRFVPEGFVLPSEADLFVKAFERSRGNLADAWIVKPAALSCGRGIFVTQSLEEIRSLDMSETSWQVSRYVNNPLLINGLKFDLRIYVTVTSFNPLRIYMHDEGLTRFATETYDPSPENFDNRFMHLTNYSVNKHNANFEFNEGNAAEDVGSKWSLGAFRKWMERQGMDHRKLWKRIHHVIIMTFLSIESQVNSAVDMHVPYKSRNCFQLFGFDILIDENLEPVLIEINFSPSLACGTPLDLRVKAAVIADTLSLAGVQPYDDVKMNGRIRPPDARKKRGNGKGDKKKGNRKKGSEKRRIDSGSNPQLTGSPLKCALDAKTLAALTPEERRCIAELEAEERCKGNFQRIFPSTDGFMYRQFYDDVRPLNELMNQYMTIKEANSREEEENRSKARGSANIDSQSEESLEEDASSRDDEYHESGRLNAPEISTARGGHKRSKHQSSKRSKNKRQSKKEEKMRIYARNGSDPRKAGASNLTAAALSFAKKPMEPVLSTSYRKKARRARTIRDLKDQRRKQVDEDAFRYLF